MDFKFYIIALAIVFLIGVLAQIGVYILGRGDPNSKIGSNLYKIMIGVTVVTLIVMGVLGWQAWHARGDPVPDEGDTFAGEFDYDRYIATNQEGLIVSLEYGKEFVPKYDSDLLTLVTTDYDTNKLVGEYKIPLVFEDKNENLHTIEYTLNVFDKYKPKLEGVKDIHLDYGRLFSKDDLEIVATDPVDGELPYTLSGTINTNKPGVYKLNASAEDMNGNKASEDFYIIVGGKNDILNGDVVIEDEYENIVIPEDSDELTQVAIRVVNGDYGVGVKRQYALAKEGYNYLDVEKEVTRLKASGYRGPEIENNDKPIENVEQDKDDKDPTPSLENDKEDKEEEIKENLLSTDEIARKVIKGEFGNGSTRVTKLTAAGYNYNTIQARVNSILK